MPGVGRFARIHDPEGNPLELWQPEASSESSGGSPYSPVAQALIPICARDSRPRQDLIDNSALGIGVVLHVGPDPVSERAFRALVEVAVV